MYRLKILERDKLSTGSPVFIRSKENISISQLDITLGVSENIMPNNIIDNIISILNFGVRQMLLSCIVIRC